MIFPRRRQGAPSLPGISVTVRSHRDLATALERTREGDVVVIDQRDLDAAAARAIAARKPRAVINAAEFISGRYANLGPELLTRAGIELFEGDRAGVLRLSDGKQLRLDGSTLYDGMVVALDVTALGPDLITARLEAARHGLATQLETFAHTASELLRREQGLLLHGAGAPRLRARISGRPVLVVGPAATPADLKRLRSYVREQKPVLIGVDQGAELLVQRGKRPDVLVLTGEARIGDKALSRSREVVLTGSGDASRARIERFRLPFHDLRTSLAGSDVGLLLAHLDRARLIVTLGSPATLDDFVDRNLTEQASNVLTRLRAGATVVQGGSVPLLYTGRVRRWQVALVALAAVAVLAVTVAATPVGHDWWHAAQADLPAGLK
jgi:uncharacterized membrane-anchored protein